VWNVLTDLITDDYSLIYGTVLLADAVPYEIPKELSEYCVYIFQEDTQDVEKCTSMAEATTFIEDCFDREDADDISQFIVIVAYEIDFIIQIGVSDSTSIDIKKIEAANVQN